MYRCFMALALLSNANILCFHHHQKNNKHNLNASAFWMHCDDSPVVTNQIGFLNTDYSSKQMICIHVLFHRVTATEENNCCVVKQPYLQAETAGLLIGTGDVITVWRAEGWRIEVGTVSP